MARITIEDCLEKVDNHFKLVLIASHRARQLQAGIAPKIEAGLEKSTIISLREIAEGLVDEEVLNEQIVHDATAEDELAELIEIEKGLMNQQVANQFGDMEEDAEDDDIEMDTLETGPQTIEEMEKIADINIDHLMEGDDDSKETTASLAEKVNDSERAIGEQLLGNVGATEAGENAATPEQTGEQTEEQPGEGKSGKDKPA